MTEVLLSHMCTGTPIQCRQPMAAQVHMWCRGGLQLCTGSTQVDGLPCIWHRRLETAEGLNTLAAEGLNTAEVLYTAKHLGRMSTYIPPLCAGVRWPMPAWVCRDVRSVCYFIFTDHSMWPRSLL